MQLLDPGYDAILVGITDDQGPELFQEVPNDDGVFQIIAGCSPSDSESEFEKQIVEILREAVRVCPLTASDREKCEAVFDRFTAR